MKIHEILTESLYDINDDVDLIYNKYFSNLVKDVNGNRWNGEVTPQTTTTAILSSDLAKKANELNPCRILINSPNQGNYYEPGTKTISICIPEIVFTLLNQNNRNKRTTSQKVSSIPTRPNDPYLGNQFSNEVTPAIVKGSINHELTHWIDDTLNNRHLTNKIKKAQQSGHTQLFPGRNVNSHYMEIQSQIHNVLQLKREYADGWDNLTFLQMISNSGPLHNVYKSLDGAEKVQWTRQLKLRMSREGLLGKNMR